MKGGMLGGERRRRQGEIYHIQFIRNPFVNHSHKEKQQQEKKEWFMKHQPTKGGTPKIKPPKKQKAAKGN